MPYKDPSEAWSRGLGFWFRLWQAQIEQSMKFWALWAETLPKPSAAELSAEADALKGSTRATPSAPPAARTRPVRTKTTVLH